MSEAVVILFANRDRLRAIRWIETAPPRTIVKFTEPLRTIPQNVRMQSMLTDLARQASYHGLRLSSIDWKLIMMDGLGAAMGFDVRLVPNLAGNGFVNLGTQSSKLSKAQMTALIDLISAYGAQNGVVFKAELNEPPPHTTVTK